MLGALSLFFFPKPCTRQCGGWPWPARSPMASDTRNQQGQPSSETTRARTAWRTSGLLWYGFIISGIMSFVEELGGKTRAAMDANYNVWRELMVEDIEK